MRKIFLVIFALTIAATVTQATDLNVSYAGANSGGLNPVWIEGGDQLKKLFESLTECHNYSLIDTPNGVWWRYDADYTYDYMLFRFNEPSGYSSGNCRWRIGATGHIVYLFRWRYVQQDFEWVDTNNGGDPPAMENLYIPSWWFSSQGQLVLLAQVHHVPPEDWIECDVMDIQYAPDVNGLNGLGGLLGNTGVEPSSFGKVKAVFR